MSYFFSKKLLFAILALLSSAVLMATGHLSVEAGMRTITTISLGYIGIQATVDATSGATGGLIGKILQGLFGKHKEE